MVEAVGIEPTMFLMSLIYSQLPSPLSTRFRLGTPGRTRTGTTSQSRDFKSLVSTVSTTGAAMSTIIQLLYNTLQVIILKCVFKDYIFSKQEIIVQ